MLQRYRFVGSYTEMGDRVFSRFGQIADWDESFYRKIVRNAPFIPDPEFKRVPFTQDELDRYADLGNRALAPESFTAKVRQCSLILSDIRTRLEAREVQEEVAQTPELDDDMLAPGARAMTPAAEVGKLN